ncbi:hypothetical protein CDD81_1316 [Ophiocordyceps australis]|uniref:BHLH domain-containing protein n=1 Tax=Ophiocordyceps australis TaxID=1399860 RepID=A0A2C5Y1A0_9HYPO|nr:hypothetical protein CDD81_1316 [Ophiocordyceps australis]
MDDDAALPPAVAMQPSPSIVSPDSLQHPAGEASTTPASSSRMSTTFDFTSAPSDDSMPSFDPAIAAFADMSFANTSMPSPFTQIAPPPPPPAQSDCFHQRSLHDKKRIKVDPETSALDTMNYWFDDEDFQGSYEIDFSKHNDPTRVATSMPGLGSGLYSTAMAPFREEDFIDDTPWDQALSDDEDMFDMAAQASQCPPETKLQAPAMVAPPAAPPPPRPPTSAPALQTGFDASVPAPAPAPAPISAPAAGSFWAPGRAPLGPRPGRRDIWDNLPRGSHQVLSVEEQRHLLEVALNLGPSSGQLPGTFMPPTGFGVGFGAGAGLSMRPARHAEGSGMASAGIKSQVPRVSPPAAVPSRNEESLRTQKTQLARRPAPMRAGLSRRLSAAETKPRSADRVAHNDVERKYRTNLKVKIAELRDAVPSLQSPSGQDGETDMHSGAPKVSKGTVLTKATEYIQHLEQRNNAIMQEHQQLTRRLQAFETLFNSTGRPELMMPNHSMTLFDPRGFC